MAKHTASIGLSWGAAAASAFAIVLGVGASARLAHAQQGTDSAADVSRAALEVRTREGQAARMPLVEERIRVSIDGQYAQTTLRQTYQNESGARVEGRYVVAAGEDARVSGFAYWNGSQKIVGEVFEKQTARRVYEEVTGLGRDPGLLEQIGEGAFSFRVFPIAAGERKRIEVSYGKYLPRRGGVIEYRAPVALADADAVVDIVDERRVVSIRSTTHHISVERPNRRSARVSVGRPLGDAKELVLRYTLADKPFAVSAAVHKDADHDGYVVVRLASPRSVPQAEITDKDITLVLDHSGSMNGEPLAQAKLAAENIVSRLSETDRINVIAFDDDTDALYDAPKAVTAEVRQATIDFIRRIGSGGGTNLALALDRALDAQRDDDHPDVLLFLTDGQSDAQETLKVAKKDRGDARVFTIGVGAGVERPLLSRLAGVKRGRFLYVDSPDAIDARMGTLYSQIEEPVIVDMSIDVEGARLSRMYPRSVPDLYRDDEVRLAARVVNAEGDKPVRITIRGTMAGKRVAYTTTVRAQRTQVRPWVGRLWAQSRVDDLLEEIALQGESDELKNETINLALAYNFVTPYTSFLAIPENELTDSAAEQLADARERKARILAAHKDAAALSRSAMPPGDPVLRVRAPRDAQQVTAYFPFGLVKDLEYDAHAEGWKTRFLVPKSVADGNYDVKVVIVHADGTTEIARVGYTIDSVGPNVTVTLVHGDDGVQVTVTADEPSRLATLASFDNTVRIALTRVSPTEFEGMIPADAAHRFYRLVVADAARNETTRRVEVGR